ncbi:MAG: uroporphyrinogen-III synthase [Bacteroidales bacterium]|nr:uroporphyrinogen-III synthase [Bacteroidales bacterium]
MKIKKILVSQPAPADLEKSPYRNLIQKHGIDITFYKFFEVVGISASDFRRTRIHIGEYTAIIFNSKQSIDHFFRMLKELRETVGEDMKYFCATESIALYLQNYIQYRKRKVFFGAQYFSDLVEIIGKHRDEKFLFPCSDEKQTEYTKTLDRAKIKYTKAPMYTSKARDLSRFNLNDYDAICLFSPVGVRSLVKNFPDIKDRNIIIAAFGSSTHAALKENGIKLTIAAPTQVAPSMAMALENHILGKQQGSVISLKGESKRSKSSGSAGMPTKRAKPVIANKEIYKQRMEEKKAQAAARRAARAAERARLEQEAAAKQEAAEKAAKKEALKKAPVKKEPAKVKTTKKAPVKKVAAKATKTKEVK